MIKKYKLVVVIPAGRKRYMEVLFPHILKQRKSIDELRFWVNTKNEEDIAYMKDVKIKYPDFVTLEFHESNNGHIGDTQGIHSFFKHTTNSDTIYIRLDDDIVWLDDNFFEKLYNFRENNPQYFLVYGNIINNAICDHLHQKNNIYESDPIYGFNCLDSNGWANPILAEKKHRIFLENIKNCNIQQYIFSPVVLKEYERCSINCISWFGSDFAKFNGEVGYDEEHWLAHYKPASIAVPNCIFGEAICSHFSFFTQRNHMDNTDLLNKYKKISETL
jgi:hypothetical protein